MRVVTLNAAENDALAPPVGEPFTVCTMAPVPVVLTVATGTYLVTLIQVDTASQKVLKRIVITLTGVAGEAPYSTLTMLDMSGVAIFDLELADFIV